MPSAVTEMSITPIKPAMLGVWWFELSKECGDVDATDELGLNYRMKRQKVFVRKV